MQDTYKFTFNSVLAFLFLLPVFFLPASIMPLGVAKAGLLSIGAIIIFLVFLYETLKQGKFVAPKSMALWSVVLLPLVYFGSAMLGVSQKMSLYGYNFEIGTFGSILMLSAILLVISMVMDSSARLLKTYGVLAVSFGLVAIFGLIKVFSGGKLLTFGIFDGVMGNPIGAWTDYGVVFGLISILALFALEILPMKATLRKLVYAFLAVSVFMLLVINFSTAWQLVFGGSLIAVVYFMTVEKKFDHSNVSNKFSLAAILLIVSLLFIFSPTVSSTQGSLGNVISNAFGVSNTDVRPALGTTLGVANTVLEAKPLLGSGPNTFDRDWLMYKPNVINATNFWNVGFPFGFGFLATQVASVGVLGSIVWVFFLAWLLLLGIKSIAKNSEQKSDRFLLIGSFVGALFMWVAAFLYVPSVVTMVLAFVFSGMFISAARVSKVISEFEIHFAKNNILNFASVLIVIVLGLGGASLGFVSIQKLASVVNFEKALVLSNTSGSSADAVEASLLSAINLSQEDVYFSAISQIEFSKAQSVLNKTTGTTEENRQAFQSAIQKSIAGAQAAVSANDGSYQNWIALGSIYEALVPKPLAIAGAYDNAKGAYAEALKRNPETPEVPLLLARLEFDNGNSEAARTHVNESLAKKQDYADAYFLLTQIEAKENNIDQAIKSLETTTILSPNNAGLFFQLGLLKYNNKDNQGTVEAMNKALALVPDYANAKYYLGLSLDSLGQHDRAVQIFEDLSVTNPDNQGVKDILSNLKAGKDALNKANSSQKPSSKTIPPITTSSKAQ